MSVRSALALVVTATVVASSPAPAPAETGTGEQIDVAVETGSCDWYCDATRYRTSAACELACADPCERLCW